MHSNLSCTSRLQTIVEGLSQLYEIESSKGKYYLECARVSRERQHSTEGVSIRAGFLLPHSCASHTMRDPLRRLQLGCADRQLR